MKLPSNEFNITKSLKFIQNMIEPLEKYKSFVKVGYNKMLTNNIFVGPEFFYSNEK